jgi:hypothetical protein
MWCLLQRRRETEQTSKHLPQAESSNDNQAFKTLIRDVKDQPRVMDKFDTIVIDVLLQKFDKALQQVVAARKMPELTHVKSRALHSLLLSE